MSASPAAARPVASYDREETITLLKAAARVSGIHSMAATMNLLTCTELPGSRDFASHVDIQADRHAGGPAVTSGRGAGPGRAPRRRLRRLPHRRRSADAGNRRELRSAH